MTASKRVLLSGYYGFSNAGDEGVLASCVAGLKSQLDGGIEIEVLSNSPQETSRLYGVRAVPRMSIPAILKSVRSCDLLISGGGSLIQDATSLQSAGYYLGLIFLARLLRRKVMVLGQGIGPLRRSVSRRLTAKALNGIAAITVRDTESAALLHEVGVVKPEIRVTADPTFMLKPCSNEIASKLLSEAGIRPGEEVIAVSLREWAETPEIEASAVSALKKMAERLPARILLFTMHTPSDTEVSKRIAQEVGGAVVQPIRWSPEVILGVLSCCRLVVSMRLHALIFAASVGVPSVGISYDPKVQSFQKAVGQDCLTLEEAIAGHLPERVEAAWNELELRASSFAEIVPKMRNAAEENIRIVNGLLNEGSPRH